MSDLIGPDTMAAAQYADLHKADEAALQLLQTHAKEVVKEVWPGGTVRIGDNCVLEWNSRLSRSIGRCRYKWGDGSPVYSGENPPIDDRVAIIEMNPYKYEKRGLLPSLQTVRHELIHAWQFLHPDGDTGHGPTFKQWLDDLDVDY